MYVYTLVVNIGRRLSSRYRWACFNFMASPPNCHGRRSIRIHLAFSSWCQPLQPTINNTQSTPKKSAPGNCNFFMCLYYISINKFQKLMPIQSVFYRLVSPLIPLHWLWSLASRPQGGSSLGMSEQDALFIETKSAELCQLWYDEDGKQWNFIQDTETNSSCPCVEAQAKMDIGRFMPHPRCSNVL